MATPTAQRFQRMHSSVQGLSKRNDWPLGIIMETYPSQDGRVQKVQVKIIGKDGPKLFLRPINEIVVLLHEDSE